VTRGAWPQELVQHVFIARERFILDSTGGVMETMPKAEQKSHKRLKEKK